jgi:hypothetical protein
MGDVAANWRSLCEGGAGGGGRGAFGIRIVVVESKPIAMIEAAMRPARPTSERTTQEAEPVRAIGRRVTGTVGHLQRKQGGAGGAVFVIRWSIRWRWRRRSAGRASAAGCR